MELEGKTDTPLDQELEHTALRTLPPEKVHVMTNYLASLPVPDEDQDLGIMVPSPSDSGSPFSSPLLTPPDIEGVQLVLKEFQEAERDRLEREKGQGNPEDNKNTLQMPHTRVNRATSLPTSVHPLSGDAYPRRLPYPDKSPDIKEVLDEVTPTGDVKITLVQSVTDRVKEIEKKHLRSERPASAGSRKCMSVQGGGLSLASSEESLAAKRLGYVSDDTSRDKRRSTSPGPFLKIPEYNTEANDDKISTTTSPLSLHCKPATQSLQGLTPDLEMDVSNDPATPMATPLDDGEGDRLRDTRSESPPPSSASSYLCMSIDDNTQYMDTDSNRSITGDDSQLLGNDDESDLSRQSDPRKIFELARRRSLLLAEVRNKNKPGGEMGGACNVDIKGVQELRSVFGGEERNGSKLKRTQSLNDKALDNPARKHQRTPSISMVTTSLHPQQ